MARDATNMPFPRSTSYQEGGSTEHTNNSNDKLDMALKVENMLLEEFNYASLTAYQSMEDRARISGFYYLLLGILVSGLAAVYQIGASTHTAIPQFLIVILLLIAAVVSVTFFIIIIRLRQAYRESIICMNVVKEFYIQQFKQQMPVIERAFRWRLATIPLGERIGSVTFMIAYLIALIGSICLAGAVFVGTQPLLSVPVAFILAGIVFIFAILLHIFYYRKALNKRSEAAIIHEQAEEIEIEMPKTDLRDRAP
jgi:hypothetical protein